MSVRCGNVTRAQEDVMFDKFGSEQEVSRFLAGELILVPKVTSVSAEGLVNGGISYAAAVDTQMFLADQRKFFREAYGKPLPRVKLPSQRPGFSWGFVQGTFMSPQWLWDCGRERFGAYKYYSESLDVLTESKRDAKKDGSYAGWCRDRTEADEELKSKSFDQIIAAGIRGMTLAEYENLFIWYHWRTGTFLDRSNWTLCSGSVYRDGHAVYASSSDGKLRVFWYFRVLAYPYLRSREAVVL